MRVFRNTKHISTEGLPGLPLQLPADHWEDLLRLLCSGLSVEGRQRPLLLRPELLQPPVQAYQRRGELGGDDPDAEEGEGFYRTTNKLQRDLLKPDILCGAEIKTLKVMNYVSKST